MVICDITFSSWLRQWMARPVSHWMTRFGPNQGRFPNRCDSSRFESSEQLNKPTPNFSDLLAMNLTGVHFLSTMFKTGKSVESRWVALVLQRFLLVIGDNHWNVKVMPTAPLESQVMSATSMTLSLSFLTTKMFLICYKPLTIVMNANCFGHINVFLTI